MEVELVEATSIGDMPPVKSVNAIDLEYKVMMKCILWLYIYIYIYISFSIYVYICRDILFLSRSSVYCKGSFVETSFPPPGIIFGALAMTQNFAGRVQLVPTLVEVKSHHYLSICI